MRNLASQEMGFKEALCAWPKPNPHQAPVPPLIHAARARVDQRYIRPDIYWLHEDREFYHWGWVGPRGQPRVEIQGETIPLRTYQWANLGLSIPEGYIPRNICGDRSCVNPDHLRLRPRNGDDSGWFSAFEIQVARALIKTLGIEIVSELFWTTEARVADALSTGYPLFRRPFPEGGS